MKRQPTEWKKAFQTFIQQGTISRLYKEAKINK